jgi:hypothetical protein
VKRGEPGDFPILGREQSSRYADRRNYASPRGQEPIRLELVVNLKMVEAIGLAATQTILDLANEVIE